MLSILKTTKRKRRVEFLEFMDSVMAELPEDKKVKQKISGCFRKSIYAKAYCRISSYIQTMANKGYNPLVAIQMAFSRQIYVDIGE